MRIICYGTELLLEFIVIYHIFVIGIWSWGYTSWNWSWRDEKSSLFWWISSRNNTRTSNFRFIELVYLIRRHYILLLLYYRLVILLLTNKSVIRPFVLATWTKSNSTTFLNPNATLSYVNLVFILSLLHVALVLKWLDNSWSYFRLYIQIERCL